MGGNLLHYPGNCGTPTVGMITVKIHLNSIISTKIARYCIINLMDFYRNTPMDQPEYMRMKISNRPLNLSKPTTSTTWLPTMVQSRSKY
jgi:hypothetical protein